MSEENAKSVVLRRVGEAAAFAAIIGVFWTLDTLSKRNIRLVEGVGLDDFRLFAEQATSAFSVWVLVPAVAWWLTRFPVSPGQIASKVAGHVLGSALFAAAHFLLMMGLRQLIYPWFGRTHTISDLWLHNLVVEYQKDIKIYVGIVAIIAIYRHIRRQQAWGADRLVVQTGSGERLLEIGDIDCLEAARNYVSVYSGEREFLLRETLASLEARLADHGFLRTHRSYVVNRSQVVGVEASDNGGQDLVLKSGRKVPLSRSRRDPVRAALGLEKART